MAEKKLAGKLTISRPSSGDERFIRIAIRDELSRSRFVEFEVSLENFALALTGLSEVQGKMTVENLENVGKVRVVETRSIECPLKSFSPREDFEKWLRENAQESGWIIDSYLRSQSSVERNEHGKTILNYRVYRYEACE